MRLLENKQLAINKKHFIFYSLFLSYGIYLIWTNLPGLFSSINSIINPSNLPSPQAGLMAGVLSERNYILILRSITHLFAGIVLVFTYISYIYSKKYARFIGILGGIIYLIYPLFLYSNNLYELSLSLSTFESLLYFFLPALTLIFLTLLYWKKLGKQEKPKEKITTLKYSFKKLTFYALFLTFGLVSFALVAPLFISIIELGISFWQPDQQIWIMLYAISFLISTILFLMAYYGFLYSKKYPKHIGIIGCIFFSIPFLISMNYGNINITSVLYLACYIVPPAIFALLIILYWKKL